MEHRKFKRADQCGAVAGAASTASAALVHCVRLGVGGLAGAAVCGLLCFALGFGMAMVRVPVSMRVLGRGRCSRGRTAMVRSAKDHGNRCVTLEGHGDHHDPKNEEADPVHAGIVVADATPTSPVRASVRGPSNERITQSDPAKKQWLEALLLTYDGARCRAARRCNVRRCSAASLMH